MEQRIYFGDKNNNMENGIGTYGARPYYDEEVQDYVYGHRYAGQFKNNNATGIGVKSWMAENLDDPSEGEVYCGEFLNNKRHGMGYWRKPSGATYIGNFENGNIYGHVECRK